LVFCILVLAAICIEPSKVFFLVETSGPLVLIDLYLLGTGVACTIVPVIPEMIETINQDERAHDKVSSLFNIFGGFGQILSTLIAGALNNSRDFNYSLDFYALSVLAFLIIYFLR